LNVRRDRDQLLFSEIRDLIIVSHVFDRLILAAELLTIKVPYSISLWAVHTKHESATRFLDKIGPAQWTRYERKASQLDGESVNAVLSVWDALLDRAARDLMVAMWLTQTPPRSPIAYPIPTVSEGISIIELDDHLSLEEKSLVQ